MRTYGKVETIKLSVGDEIVYEGTTTGSIKADTYIRNGRTGEMRPATLINYNDYFMKTQARTEDGKVYDIVTTYASDIAHHWANVDGKSWEVLDNEL